MRIVLYACCMAMLTGCYNENDRVLPKAKKPEKGSKYAGILAKCKAITINDTVRVYFDESIQDTFGVDDAYQFTGTELDSAETTLFPTEVSSGPKNNFSGINACYAFAIDLNCTGIIVRTPSMNQHSSSVKLFTLDKLRDTLTDFTELADRWDIAAEASEKISWLYRDDKMKLRCYIWAQNIYDHHLLNNPDTKIETTNYYHLVDLSKPKYDTINREAGALLKTFQAANRKFVEHL